MWFWESTFHSVFSSLAFILRTVSSWVEVSCENRFQKEKNNKKEETFAQFSKKKKKHKKRRRRKRRKRVEEKRPTEEVGTIWNTSFLLVLTGFCASSWVTQSFRVPKAIRAISFHSACISREALIPVKAVKPVALGKFELKVQGPSSPIAIENANLQNSIGEVHFLFCFFLIS